MQVPGNIDCTRRQWRRPLLYNPCRQCTLICQSCPLTARLRKYSCKGHLLTELRDRGERNVCEIAMARFSAWQRSLPRLPFKSQRTWLIIPVNGAGRGLSAGIDSVFYRSLISILGI